MTLVLAMAWVFALFGGCGGNGTEPTVETTVKPTVEPGDVTASAEVTEVVVDYTQELYSYTLPLAGDVTLTAFYTFPAPFVSFIENGPFDCDAYKYMNENSGIMIDWQWYTMDVANANFMILISSGEYPDLLYNFNANYTAGIDAGIDEGIIYPLEDYIEEYMPCYNYWLNNDEEFAKAAATDYHYGAIWGYYPTEQIEGGMMLREDLLDKYNFDSLPKTYDEYYNLLMAFKVDTGSTQPFCSSLPQGAGFNMDSIDETSDTELFVVIDDDVIFYGTQESTKEYFELCAKWFADGLINPDYLTSDMNTDGAYIKSGQVVTWMGNFSQLLEYTEDATDIEGINVVGSYTMRRNEEDEVHIRTAQWGASTTCWAISTRCENIEAACAWLDYWFSEDGSILGTWGREGYGYDVDTNGNKTVSDNINNNPTGMPVAFATTYYTLNRDVYWKDGTRDSVAWTENQKQCQEIWGETGKEYVYPHKASLTSDEGTEFSLLISDIVTFMVEAQAKFVTGVWTVENDWDAYVSTLETLNYQRAEGILQDAYDRYKAR